VTTGTRRCKGKRGCVTSENRKPWDGDRWAMSKRLHLQPLEAHAPSRKEKRRGSSLALPFAAEGFHGTACVPAASLRHARCVTFQTRIKDNKRSGSKGLGDVGPDAPAYKQLFAIRLSWPWRSKPGSVAARYSGDASDSGRIGSSAVHLSGLNKIIQNQRNIRGFGFFRTQELDAVPTVFREHDVNGPDSRAGR